jgi:hypothetical protein
MQQARQVHGIKHITMLQQWDVIVIVHSAAA